MKATYELLDLETSMLPWAKVQQIICCPHTVLLYPSLPMQVYIQVEFSYLCRTAV